MTPFFQELCLSLHASGISAGLPYFVFGDLKYKKAGFTLLAVYGMKNCLIPVVLNCQTRVKNQVIKYDSKAIQWKSHRRRDWRDRVMKSSNSSARRWTSV